MDITITAGAGETRITLGGPIDEKGAEQLKSCFESLKLDNVKRVNIDFSKVSFIGSAGLGKLLLFYKKAAATNSAVRLENCPAGILSLLKEVRLDTLFTVT